MAITEKYVSGAGGGAHDGSTEADAFSWTEMVTDINAGGKAGNRYNFKGSVARTTNTDTVTGDGSSTSPIIIRGYTTTIGDGFQGRTSGNGALVTTNMPTVTYTTGRFNGSGADWILYETINFSGAPSAGVLTVGASSAVKSCVVGNSSTNAAAVGITTNLGSVIFDNDVTLSGASGGAAAISVTGNEVRVIANRVRGGPAVGILVTGRATILDNLVYACTGVGIAVTNTAAYFCIYGNTIVGGTTDGIDVVTGTTVFQCALNNMITDNGGYGIDGVSAANAIFAAYNRTRDNTSGADNLATDWLAATKYGQVTTDTGGAETDYVNAGSNDYTLVSGSPAKGAGWWPYRDIGALQRQESGGGSAAPSFGLSGPLFRGRP